MTPDGPGWPLAGRLSDAQGCLMTLQGEAVDAPPVVAALPTPDGLISGHSDGAIRRWALPSSRPGFVSKTRHRDWITDIAVSPDGASVATASRDRDIFLWSAATGAYRLRCLGHTSWVFGVHFSPDGTRLASASDDGTVKVWSASSGECLLDCRGHTSGVYSVAFSDDGALLASGGFDEAVCIWEAWTGRLIRRITGHHDIVWRVCFAPHTHAVGSASGGPTPLIHDAITGRCAARLQGHTDSTPAIAFDAKGQYSATSGYDRTLVLWHTETATPLSRFSFPEPFGWRLAFSPHGRWLASTHPADVIRIWPAPGSPPSP